MTSRAPRTLARSGTSERTSANQLPSSKGLRDDVSEELAEVLDRALSADPELRPNSAAEFLQAVNRAAEGARAAARWLRGSPLD